MRASVFSETDPPRDGLSALARPVLWLAVAAFLAGFVGYLLLAAPVAAYAAAHDGARPISGPVSADWNIAKAI